MSVKYLGVFSLRKITKRFILRGFSNWSPNDPSIKKILFPIPNLHNKKIILAISGQKCRLKLDWKTLENVLRSDDWVYGLCPAQTPPTLTMRWGAFLIVRSRLTDMEKLTTKSQKSSKNGLNYPCSLLVKSIRLLEAVRRPWLRQRVDI